MTNQKSGAKIPKAETPAIIQTTQPAEVQNPTTLIALAIEKGATIDSLEKLMNLEERWRASHAKREFFSALSKFQSEVPQIMKVRQANFGDRGAKYNYAALGDIAEAIKKAIFDNGLSYRWEIKDSTDNGKAKITVSCLVSHKDGHTETTTMEGFLDNSGSKNEIQQRGSTITYLRRYTLVGALGIATDDIDNDNRDNKAKPTGKVLDEKKSALLMETIKKEVDNCKTSVEIKQSAPGWHERATKEGMNAEHVEELKLYINNKFTERQSQLQTQKEGQ